MRKLLARIWNLLPVLAILFALLWACGVVAHRRAVKTVDEGKIIRIAHWQLELGMREGLDAAAREYEKLHPGIRIEQEAIPESGYGEWLTVQMLGGTAPDIVEMGGLAPNLITVFYARYILPLTPYVSQPNPYNVGTDLETVPLYNTFLDGMRISYIDELQEYMNLSLCRMSIRLFYNKTLLKELTGEDEVSTDFRKFISLCERIKARRQPDGQAFIPIANSKYHFGGWWSSFITPISYPAHRQIDYNLDGRFGKDEWAAGFLSGKIDFSNPAYHASFAAFSEIQPFFQSGWMGLSRDEAIFNFAQQKAVFISSGLWEAGGIQQLASGRFDLGVVDFPIFSANDPVYGKIIEGERFENPGGSVPFSVTRTSKHPKEAVDFLLFLTSQKQNEKFNARLGWLPIVDGAKILPELKAFEPKLTGTFPAFDPGIGGETSIKWSQLQGLYMVGQISYEDMTEDFNRFYKVKGREDFEEYLRNTRRGLSRDEQLAVLLRVKSMQGNSPEDWTKYRNISSRLLQTELNYLKYSEVLTKPDKFRQEEYYKYTPEIVAEIRERLTRGGPGRMKHGQSSKNRQPEPKL